MSDLISRSNICNYIKEEINPYGKPFKGTAYELGLKLMEHIEDMEDAEPVEAVPVVHGEWIAQDEGLTKFMCSVCNGKNYGGHEKFCPDCGADMRKKVNE